MAFYTAYHRHPHNKITHFIGVPAIIFSLFFAMSWFRVPLGFFEITLAMVFTFVILTYYFILDWKIALPFSCVALLLLMGAHRLSHSVTPKQGVLIFLISFIGGWIFQLAGHAIEKRRPAFADNFFQIFIAPLFLVAEIFFVLGFRKDLEKEIENQSHQHE
jgi:uncharacterized membrane protein YGL010W